MIPFFVISSIFIIVIATGTWMYLINIYEVRPVVDENINPNGTKRIVITTKLLNSFGRKAPFRSEKLNYEIVEGATKIKQKSFQNNSLIITTDIEQGNIIIELYSKYSRNPMICRINTGSE